MALPLADVGLKYGSNLSHQTPTNTRFEFTTYQKKSDKTALVTLKALSLLTSHSHA